METKKNIFLNVREYGAKKGILRKNKPQRIIVAAKLFILSVGLGDTSAEGINDILCILVREGGV